MDNAQPFDPDDILTRRMDTRIRRVNGQFLLSFGETAVELSESGSLLYEHMDGTRTVGMLAAVLAETYGVSEQVALADTSDFLSYLLENSLAHVRDSRA
jgi:hypothetical protein